MAEFEREAISKRTKEALAAAKAKGNALGNYQRIAKAKRAATTARAEAVRPMITETLHLSTQAAANELNRRGLRLLAASDGMRCRCIVPAIIRAFETGVLNLRARRVPRVRDSPHCGQSL